jgi:hypothetical protein
MLLRRTPEIGVAPFHEAPQLFYLWMLVFAVVFERKTLWAIGLHIAT